MHNLLFIMKFGWPYMQKYWQRLALGIVLGILFGLSNAAFVWATKTLFERLAPATITTVANPIPASEERIMTAVNTVKTNIQQALDSWLPLMGRSLDWRQIIGGLMLLSVPVFFRGAVGYMSTYCMSWVSERMINDLRISVLAKLNSLSLDFFNRSTMGNLLTHINGDTATLHRCMIFGFADMIKEPVTLIGLVGAMCILDWQLTLVAVGFLCTCIIPMRLLGKKARNASHGGVVASVSQSSLLVEALSGIRVVKAFGLEEEQVKRFRQYSRQLIHHGMKGVQARGLIHPIIETSAMLGAGALVLWIVHTHRTIPNMVGFLTGMFLIYNPVKKIAGINIMFHETSVGVERLIKLLREQPTVKEATNARRVTSFTSELRFENVSFSYGDQLVVRDVDFVVPRGFKLGVAGESGSGKSTLANLVFRFYDPTHGRITLDGVDIREIAITDLRQLMALVSQDIVLFDNTVAENIAYGRSGATRIEVEQAARQAYAHEFIMQLPQGYDTRIGERGATLSGGQRQRLSIARAFVRNAPILVLDEATAALDSQAEAEVQTAIDHLAENRTVISIAHRLSTLRTSDRIIVLSQGRIIEDGGFADLVSRGGVFANMAQRQGIN